MKLRRVRVHIRRNADGTVRSCRDIVCFHDSWATGYYRLNKTRAMIFDWIGPDNSPPPITDTTYSIKLTDHDGNTIYQEGDWP